jgi:hypothetical protein
LRRLRPPVGRQTTHEAQRTSVRYASDPEDIEHGRGGGDRSVFSVSRDHFACLTDMPTSLEIHGVEKIFRAQKKENPQMLSQMRAKASLLLEEISFHYRVMQMS